MNEIRKRKKLVVILAVILITMIFVSRTFISSRQQPQQYQKAFVEKGTIVATVGASGNVLISNIINITTAATGLVKKVYITDGDKVTEGDILAEITLDQQGKQKNSSGWSTYLSAKNTLDAANATAYSLRSSKDTSWKKFYDLATSSTYQNSNGSPKDDIRNSSSEFQSSQADWLAAEAKYKNQQAVIQQSYAAMGTAWLSYQSSSPIVTAPNAGTISNIGLVEGMVLASQTNSSTGETAASSQRVAVLQSEANPILVFNLTEIDVPKVKVGQKSTITLDSVPNKTFTGKVATVDRIGTTNNNVTVYPTIIELNTTSPEILPNMTANTSIIIETKSNVLLIPSSAIQIQGNESFVRVLKNGREQQVPVQVGISSDTKTEVTSGLSEGDEVITGTITTTQTQQRGSGSFFGGGGLGGGAFRPGGFGGGGRR